jgi:hypothetical protein
MPSLFDEVVGHIIFNNKTDLPFEVSTWKKVMDGLSKFEPEIIGSKQERLLSNSTTGEWHLTLPYGDDFKIWTEKGLESGYMKPNEVYHQIGKFRSQSGVSGKYAWINGTDIFLCEHTIDPKTGMGMITLSYNMDAPFFKNQKQNV